MSLLLTDRQRLELNSAILEYLSSHGEKYQNTVSAFRSEAEISDTTTSSAPAGLLEKKWTSVVRLQKKVMELEAQVEALKKRTVNIDLTASGEATSSVINMKDSKLLPKPPHKSVLAGHRAAVTALAMHPIYSIFASGSEDCSIRVWDHESSQYERTLKGHTGPVTGLAFENKGNVLASCSADMSAKLWDMSTFACTKTLKGHDHVLSAIVFLPSGDNVLTCSRDQTIKIWDTTTGYCTRTFAGHTDWVKTISVSVDGKYLASGSVDQSIIIWDLTTTKVIQVSSSLYGFIIILKSHYAIT
jgi:platelet-activating factor acetylhydrolase IB subunit alpha